MVRAPKRTCPNLAQINDDAPTDLIAAFLSSPAFANFRWMQNYNASGANHDARSPLAEILNAEQKRQLEPLETEAARKIEIESESESA